MAALLIVPQVVVAIFAPWVGYWSELWGRKPLLLAGFAIETVRALLFAFSDPWLIIAAQVLDGATGAIVTVLMVLVITDLTTGTGRFNRRRACSGRPPARRRRSAQERPESSWSISAISPASCQ